MENVIEPPFSLIKSNPPVPNDLKFKALPVVAVSKFIVPLRFLIVKFPLPPASLSIVGSLPDYPILNTPSVTKPVVELVNKANEFAEFEL